MILTLTYGMGRGQMLYINRKLIDDSLFDDSCNACHIDHRLQAIWRQIV